LERCTLPLTGINCIRRVITDLGMFSIEDGAFILQEIAPGVSVDDVKKATAGKLIVSPDLKTMLID